VNSQLLLFPALFVSSFSVVSATSYLASNPASGNGNMSGAYGSQFQADPSANPTFIPAPPPPLPPAQYAVIGTPDASLMALPTANPPPVVGITGVRLPPVVGITGSLSPSSGSSLPPPLPLAGAGGYVLDAFSAGGASLPTVGGSGPLVPPPVVVASNAPPPSGVPGVPPTTGGSGPVVPTPAGLPPPVLVPSPSPLGIIGPAQAPAIAPIPVPAPAGLMACGLGLLALVRRRRAAKGSDGRHNPALKSA